VNVYSATGRGNATSTSMRSGNTIVLFAAGGDCRGSIPDLAVRNMNDGDGDVLRNVGLGGDLRRAEDVARGTDCDKDLVHRWGRNMVGSETAGCALARYLEVRAAVHNMADEVAAAAGDCIGLVVVGMPGIDRVVDFDDIDLRVARRGRARRTSVRLGCSILELP
jgi:hypothetical protein